MHDTLGREQIKKRGDGKRIQNFLGQVDHFCIVMIWVKSPTTTPRRLAGWLPYHKHGFETCKGDLFLFWLLILQSPTNRQNNKANKFFIKCAIPGLFSFIFVFSIHLIVNKCWINFADDWIRTADLWYWKRLLYQLSHNHCPRPVSLPTYFGRILYWIDKVVGNHNEFPTLFENIF